MNLRFSPTMLALALSLRASAGRTDKAQLGNDLVEQSSYHPGGVRRAMRSSTSIFKQGSVDAQGFYVPDVGILQGIKRRIRFGSVQMNGELKLGAYASDSADSIPRFLRDEVAPRCGTNGTCAPKMCYHSANVHNIFASAAAFNSICNGYTDVDGNTWTLEGCFPNYPGYPGVQDYVKNVYCPLAKCFVDGGSYGSCYCEACHSACQVYVDERPYSVRN